MESEFKFFVPPPFSPFSTASPGGFDPFNNDYELNNQQVTDLEAHFSSHFNLEIENGINRNNYDSNICKDVIYEKSYDNLDDTSWDLDNFNNEETIEDYNYVTDLKSCLYDEVNDLDNDDNVNSLPGTNEDFDFINIDVSNVDCADGIPKKNDKYETKDEFIIQELTSLSDTYISEDFLNNLQNVEAKESLPPMEMAFSKHSCNYKQKDSMQRNDLNAEISDTNFNDGSQLSFNNLDNYSYPNNILNNFTFEKYVNEKVVSGNCERDYKSYRDGGDRKLSVCESVESDAQTATDVLEDISDSVLYGENDFLIDLEELGLNMEEEDSLFDVKSNCEHDDAKSRSRFERKTDRDLTTGERVCFWHNCSEQYPNQSTLVEHIEKVHVNSYKGEEFSCLWSECSRGRRPFNARYKLLIHMRVHSGHKPNRCNHPGCGKSFSRLENLKIHRRSHTGERPYRCQAPLCRKAFSNSSDRAKHQRTHFNARPYACQVEGCSKRYTDPSSLRKHVKNHSAACAPPPAAAPHRRPAHCDAPPALAVFDCAAGDRRRSQPLSHSSPVKLNTLKSIRNKLSEQSGRKMADVWQREGATPRGLGVDEVGPRSKEYCS